MKRKVTVQPSDAKVFVEVEYRLPSGQTSKACVGGDSAAHCLERFARGISGHLPIVNFRVLPVEQYAALRK